LIDLLVSYGKQQYIQIYEYYFTGGAQKVKHTYRGLYVLDQAIGQFWQRLATIIAVKSGKLKTSTMLSAVVKARTEQRTN